MTEATILIIVRIGLLFVMSLFVLSLWIRYHLSNKKQGNKEILDNE